MPSHLTSWRSILILSSLLCLGLPFGSFPQVSPPKPCIRLYSSPYVLHDSPTFFFSIWSPEQYWVRRHISDIQEIKLQQRIHYFLFRIHDDLISSTSEWWNFWLASSVFRNHIKKVGNVPLVQNKDFVTSANYSLKRKAKVKIRAATWNAEFQF